jgi:hypothetical protein
MNLDDYLIHSRAVDKLNDIFAVKLGLFGETGSILTTAKKKSREGSSYDYVDSITEELGDAFWYFSRLIDRLNFQFPDVIPPQLGFSSSSYLFATAFPDRPVAQAPSVTERELPIILPKLGSAAAKLLEMKLEKNDATKEILIDFFSNFLHVLSATGVPFSIVLANNLEKIESRFLLPNVADLPIFDSSFEPDEQLPSTFAIDIIQRGNGKTYLKWNGVFIGDPLTDNVAEEDGYRFHDVFHMANAAILGWSPTFRALIRHKRKSSPSHDEVEDGGRAIVIEEGLTAWIFSQAKHADLFSGRDTVSFDLLKRIKHFVAGFEVEACPISLWEKCILDGYSVFRQMRTAKSGRILGNLNKRTIEFEPLK